MEGGASSPDGNSAFHDHVIAQICREARLADAGWSAQHHRLPGQTHDLVAEILTPVLETFLLG